MNIGVYYGSTTGNTAVAAERIGEELALFGEVEVKSIADVGLDGVDDRDLVVLGVSTWGGGKVQDDWVGLETFAGIDLSGKKVAVFGTGDQEGYAETFVDAIGVLAEAVLRAGGTLIGFWPVEGYAHTASMAEWGNWFAGLALDEENQASLSGERIRIWTTQIAQEARQ